VPVGAGGDQGEGDAGAVGDHRAFGASRAGAALRRLRQKDLAPRGDGLPGHPHAVDGVVFGLFDMSRRPSPRIKSKSLI